MRTYVVISIAAAVVYLIALGSFSRNLRALPVSWQLLAYSGIPLSLGGLGFVLRFWHPTRGPYIANSTYPFGSHLHAWAVSFGFMWLAFGLLFTFGCLQAQRTGSRQAWFVLLATWLLAWLPHAVIGVAFANCGANRESVAFYLRWGSDPAGFTILVTSTLIMILHFGLSIGGFIATGLQIRRSHPRMTNGSA